MEGIVNLFFKENSAREEKARLVRAEEKREDLLKQIKDVKIRLAAIQSCFDLETDFDMISCYISEMDALEKRYGFLIKKAKEERICAFETA